MELRDLEFFVAVAEELHFGRAADRLRIVPASVTQRIQALERELGVVLFERTSRRVALTDAGTQLLRRAQAVLVAADQLSEDASRMRTGEQARLRVGFAPGSAHLIDALGRRVAARRPGVELVAESMWSLDVLAALLRGDLSLGIVRDPLPADGVDSTVVATYQDSFVAVAAPGPLAGRTRLSMAQFDGQRFLLNERDTAPGVHDATVRFFAEQQVRPVWRLHRLHEQEQQLSLVAAGAGSALVHSHRADITHPGVRVIPLVERGPQHRLHLVWRDRTDEPGVAAVVGLIPELRTELAADS
ncbi:LysR family transcriptional regulator [Tsukamurella sp. 8F]|uniref:LysR family transcriptional regulator n=1 Tax=unclassified Tsukamurella TaxID=2633480 RepID=UPI0023B89D70|nr:MULTISPECIES: LysR family transcriptional regulator [unclassified Tsukamurella]MDF0531110.1 LysR family transcriptional regulator [Tsukamurella sp. 8J]MDF0588356.1 LysR family transcriptional regulator [Tsukamurella sp. 8F]